MLVVKLPAMKLLLVAEKNASWPQRILVKYDNGSVLADAEGHEPGENRFYEQIHFLAQETTFHVWQFHKKNGAGEWIENRCDIKSGSSGGGDAWTVYTVRGEDDEFAGDIDDCLLHFNRSAV